MKIFMSVVLSMLFCGISYGQYPQYSQGYNVNPGPIDANEVMSPIQRVVPQIPQVPQIQSNRSIPLPMRQPDIYHYHYHEFGAQPRNDGFNVNPYGCYQRDLAPPIQYYQYQYQNQQNYCVPQYQQPNYCVPQTQYYQQPQQFQQQIYYYQQPQRYAPRINILGFQQ
jgi:hypothetical protein